MRGHLHLVDGSSATAAPSRPPIRVVLADDHPALRRALRGVLEREADLVVVAEAVDLERALRQVSAHHPEVVVLGLRMPSGSSAERIRMLREQAPGTEIVMITMQQNSLLADQTRSAGAIGFVLTDTANEELCDAVRRAARRVEYRSPRLA